ncbi:MAG TPA: LysR substrate-binding domain-containing protein [Pararobbsia sp.]|nr:LysR substrate-binding domain-containing protein [Pararobbsia sp.]
MRPHQIRALIAVADHGSIRAAARGVGLSQAALTKAIRELEEEMGIAIVRRATHGIQLTEAGGVLVAHARAISAEMRGALDDIERVKGTSSSGTVTAAVSPVSSVVLLAAAYRAFRRRMPDARVDLIEGHPLHSMAPLRDGSIDFVVVGLVENHSHEEFAVIDLLSDELVFACRRGHPLAHARSIADLRDADWVLHAPSDDFRSALSEALVDQDLLAPRWLTRTPNLTHVMTLVTECDAIVALPSRMWRASWMAGTFARIRVKERLPTLNIAILTRQASPLTFAAQVLIDCFREAAREYLAAPSKAMWS